MYHIRHTVPVVHEVRQAQSVSTLHSFPFHGDEDPPRHEVSNLLSTNMMKSSSSSTKEEYVLWYSGILGTMTVQKKSTYSKSPNASAEGKAPLISEAVWTFRTSFISYALQLRYNRSFGHVSRSLNIYPVLSV